MQSIFSDRRMHAGFYKASRPTPPPPPPDPEFVLDEFLGVGSIEAHVGEKGAAWTQIGALDASIIECFSGKAGLQSPLAGGALMREVQASGVPPTADYYVEAVLERGNSFVFNSETFRFAGRRVGSAGYFVTLFLSGLECTLTMRAQFGDNLYDAPLVFAPNTAVTLKLQMVGDQISLLVNDVEVASVTDASHAGEGGVSFGMADSTESPSFRIRRIQAHQIS